MTHDILRTVTDEPMTFGELHSRLGRPKKPMLYAALRALNDCGVIVHQEGLVRTSRDTARILADHEATRPTAVAVDAETISAAWDGMFGDVSMKVTS